MTIRLHHVPFSRSFRVLWMLEELGLTYDVSLYAIRDGSLRQGDFPQKSPAVRVPALEIDGHTIFESGAILETLAETHRDAGFGRAPGHPERIRYLEILHYSETMASLIEQLNLNHIFLRPPAKPSPAVVKLNTIRLRQTLLGLEQLLGEQDYLLASGFSAADMMMGFNLFAAPFYVMMDDMPRLTAYRDRLEARPAFQSARARDGEQDFYTQDFYPVPEA